MEDKVWSAGRRTRWWGGARQRGVFYVSLAAATSSLRALCAQLVRECLLASAGRRGAMLAYYPAGAANLAARNVPDRSAP
jgi:hypothetical protein